MLEELKKLLGFITGYLSVNGPEPIVRKRPKGRNDFRAVEIVPSLLCCEAAKRASGRRHLLGKAPRMPLMGCTMPMNCACAYRKNADRRDGDRRLLGAGTSRWFAGVDTRQYRSRRLAEK
jgi:hypothetical protein